MKSILLPTDFTDTTSAALDWAKLFARQTGAAITLLHVYQPMLADTTLPMLGDTGVGMLAAHDLEALSQNRLSELATQLETEGFTAQADWRLGTVEEEILLASRQYAADLLIAPHGGLATIFDRLIGSAADGLARDATCPVLVIPMLSDTDLHLPAQVRSIVYAMQPDSTQSEASDQLGDLTAIFDVPVDYVLADDVSASPADLVVVTDYKKGGLFSTNPADRILSDTKVPVLVYHVKA
ncbi:MAG: universal stress protein [Bacteroidetes bacterium]|nr:universal stress protein [Fibrella sp.]